MESDQSLLRVAPLARFTIFGGRDGPNDSGKPHPSNRTRYRIQHPHAAATRTLRASWRTTLPMLCWTERRPAGPISSTRLLVGAEGLEPPTFAFKGGQEPVVKALRDPIESSVSTSQFPSVPVCCCARCHARPLLGLTRSFAGGDPQAGGPSGRTTAWRRLDSSIDVCGRQQP